MKTNPLLFTSCAAALIIPFSASAQDAKKYQLLLERPVKAGYKSHEVLSGTLEKSQRISQGDKVVKSDVTELKVEITGVQEILEVSEKGNVKKLSFTVETFTIRSGEDPVKEAFKPGTVIIGSGTDKERETYEVEGKTVDGPAAEALTELISLTGIRKHQPDEDATFDTATPRAAGSEWKLDGQKIIDSLPAETPVNLKPEGITGKAKIAGVKTSGDLECLDFHINITMKPESMGKMPPGFKLDKAELKLVVEKLVPLAPEAHVPAEKATQQMEINGSIPSAAGELKLAFFNRTVKSRTSKPVK